MLERSYFSHESDGTPLYSCQTNEASRLPVYTSIFRIRRDITSVVEDYLSLEQLRDVRIGISVVRPLVDKLYEMDDISIGMVSFLVSSHCAHEFPSITSSPRISRNRAQTYMSPVNRGQRHQITPSSAVCA